LRPVIVKHAVELKKKVEEIGFWRARKKKDPELGWLKSYDHKCPSFLLLFPTPIVGFSTKERSFGVMDDGFADTDDESYVYDSEEEDEMEWSGSDGSGDEEEEGKPGSFYWGGEKNRGGAGVGEGNVVLYLLYLSSSSFHYPTHPPESHRRRRRRRPSFRTR
jgi:hypothetical protein